MENFYTESSLNDYMIAFETSYNNQKPKEKTLGSVHFLPKDI